MRGLDLSTEERKILHGLALVCSAPNYQPFYIVGRLKYNTNYTTEHFIYI
jgi:hypothetical protein